MSPDTGDSELVATLTASPWFQTGRDSAQCFSARPAWLFRRVESIEFIARRSVRRHVSVDFDIPDGLPDLSDRGAPKTRLVPISVLQKAPPLIDFDLRGPDGLPASLYKRDTNQALDFGLVLGMADLVPPAGAVLSPALLDALALLVSSERPDNEGVAWVAEHLKAELTAHASGPDTAAQIAATVDLAGQLANNLILWVAVPGGTGSDRIVKFSYVDEYGEDRQWWKRVLVGCSWWERTLYLTSRHAGSRTRYHLDVLAPGDGVELMHVRAIGFPSAGPFGPGSSARSGELMGESQIADRRAHVYLGERTAHSHRVVVHLRMAATRQGFVSGCLLAALAIAVLVSVAFSALPEAAAHVDATAVLLAAVPIVLGYVLVRPGERPQERYHTVGVRAMALLSGALPILGALTLALTPLSTATEAWAGLVIASWVLVAALLLSWLFAAPAREAARGERWVRIRRVSGALVAAGLLAGVLVSCQPYSHVTAATMAVYMRGHRAVVLLGAALAAGGIVWLYPFLGGVWRAISIPSGARRERRVAGALLIGGAVACVSGALATLSLTAWQALSVTRVSDPHTVATVARVADVLANATLAPIALFVFAASLWLMWRPNLPVNLPLLLTGTLAAIPAIVLRAASLLGPPEPQIDARASWIAFALWIALVAVALRVGRRSRVLTL